MAEQETIISSMACPASFAVISRTTTNDLNGNRNHIHSTHAHITQNGHHKYRTAPSPINLLNHQSSISSSSSSSHIHHSQSYHNHTLNGTATTQHQINHLTLSVTPTSVSSNSSCSLSSVVSPNTPKLVREHQRTISPTQLISKSYHNHNDNDQRRYRFQRHQSLGHDRDPGQERDRYWCRNDRNNTNNGHNLSLKSITENTNEHNNNNTNDNTNKCKSSIISRTLLQLIELGINPSTIRWPNITMESHEYITILMNGNLKIIDTISKQIMFTLSHCCATSAMMNPQHCSSSDDNNMKLLALRNENTMRVMQLNDNNQICNDVMMMEHKEDDVILYWKWIDSEIIAYITASCVYHWMPTLTQSSAKPILTLNNGDISTFIQYINYAQSANGNYLLVQGLTQSNKENDVDGVLTLYDSNNTVICPRMNAFGGCFVTLSSFRDHNVTLFCYTKKETYNDTHHTALYIVELRIETDDDEKEYSKYSQHIRVSRKVDFHHRNDFVVSMVQSSRVLYAVTKLGYLLIFDISSGINLYNEKVSRDVIFLVTQCNNGIIALDRTGKLTLFSFEFHNKLNHKNKNKNVCVLTYNVYNNSFSIKYKEICYESSFFMESKDKTSKKSVVLCCGHIKMVLCKALSMDHIGFVSIYKYKVDGSTQWMDNSCVLTQDLRFLKISITDKIEDKSFGKLVKFYHFNYGVPHEHICSILSDNMFNYDCDELKIATMNYLLNKSNDFELKLSVLNGDRSRLNGLSNEELIALEHNVNDSYLRIRKYIRSKYKCIVCYEKEKHILFKPCHHYVVCENCDQKLSKCPVCNQDIKQRIKVYQ